MKGRLGGYLPLLVIWLPLLINAAHDVIQDQRGKRTLGNFKSYAVKNSQAQRDLFSMGNEATV